MKKYEFRLCKIPKCKYCNKDLELFRIDDDFCSHKCKEQYNKNLLNQYKDISKTYKSLRRI